MNLLQELFEQYDKSRACAPLFTSAKYGFEWELEDGIIYYPDCYFASEGIRLLQLNGVESPLALCDDDLTRHGRKVHGVPVESLESAAAKYPNALLVHAGRKTYLTGPVLAAIAKKLPPRLASRMISFRQLGDFLPEGDKKTKLYDVYRKSVLPAAERSRIKIKEAYSLYEDTLSKTVFLSILKRYLLSSDAMIPVSSSTEQYFDEVYSHREDEVFVDCGGFVGDTLQSYLQVKAGRNFKQYLVFEPDPTNYAKLESYLSTLPEAASSRVKAFPYAVGEEDRELSFNFQQESVSSSVTKDGADKVSCVTLDNAVAGYAPTFIKMDLEGYEAMALLGTREIIANARPVLAICVYHHVFDLWELPLLIKRFYPGYKFFLRAYGEQLEYVCYAVPEERLASCS